VRQTRRVFLRSAAAATAGTLLLPGATGLTRAQGLARGGRFTQSVASGQPSPNGITLWTKVDGLERTSRLQVEIARDEGFANVVYRQDVLADAESGFAVHHRAEHPVLRPGEPFFYRFYTCDENSPVGRFRTAVPADSRDPIRIGFFSCQAFEAGFYTAHEGLLNEPDLDLVVCLGDYVYERIFYGEGGVRADRTGVNRDGDVQSLAEYREKYALYHTDQRLLELRRRHPMVAIWDDHEAEDNYARDLPGEATPDAQRRSPFLARRAAGYRAWFEHMPRIRVVGEPDRTYGRVPLGANAEVFLLDQRQYRDDQPCDDQFFVPCTDSEAPGRTYLGAAQKEWLKASLADSRATWKVVGNQAMIMALDGPPRNEINKDQWDGYAAERQELLDFVAARGIRDVTFITGDIHTFFAGNVTATGRQGAPTDPPPVATEFVGGSVTSEGVIPEQGTLATDAGLIASNPHLVFADERLRGYGVLEARPEELLVTFRAARTVKQPTSDVFDLARFRVARGTPQVEVLATAAGVTRP
jgi:alkaline phosphatase D